MRGGNLTRVLVCLWILWSSFRVGGDLKFVRLLGPVTGQACLTEVAAKAPYERQVGLMRGYQDITMEAREAHPSGIWYVCFPEEHDPRDK